MFDRNSVPMGFDVYTRDDQKIGSVTYVAPNYFEISTGFLGLGHPLYIPFSAVSRVDSADQRVYLNVDRDNIPTDMWKNQPTAATEPVGTMAGTMPAATAERPATGQTGQMWLSPQQLQGKTLYAWNGDKIGDVSGVGPNYVDVPTGILDLGPNLYVPFNAIDYCDRKGCYVNATMDQIKNMNWSQKPTFTTATTNAPAAGTFAQGAEAMRVPLYEEELEARRHREQVGEVVIQRNVQSQQRTINVPVEHEEVRVERRPVDRPVAPGEHPFTEGEKTVEIPVYEDKVEVEKVPRVYEEVVVQPETVTQEKQFTGTVRRETANVTPEGGAAQFVQQGAGFTGAPTGFRPWTDVMPTYRQDWQNRFGTSGMTWQQVEPAYQFGYTNFYNPAYQNMTWTQASPRLQQEWQTRYPNSPWDKVKNFVESEWDHLRGRS